MLFFEHLNVEGLGVGTYGLLGEITVQWIAEQSAQRRLIQAKASKIGEQGTIRLREMSKS